MTAMKSPPMAPITSKPARPDASTNIRRVSARVAALKPRFFNAVIGVSVVALLAALWQGYKALGQATGDQLFGVRLPIATDDLSMPSVGAILGALVEPARRGSSTPLGVYLLEEASVTLREAAYGLTIGSLLGLAFAIAFLHLPPLSRGLMPWLVASQAVPLVAIAPMVVIWGGKAGLPAWIAVTGIAAYLAFFPMTVNALRGLKSPPRVQTEFLHSVGAGKLQFLFWLRLPAALPYIFAGLRLAATASVVGAIVGELSAGTGRGIGRAILTSSYYYSNGPEKLYAAVLIAAITGIVFVQLLNLVERFVLRNRHTR